VSELGEGVREEGIGDGGLEIDICGRSIEDGDEDWTDPDEKWRSVTVDYNEVMDSRIGSEGIWEEHRREGNRVNAG
jgi:hypothetical protein